MSDVSHGVNASKTNNGAITPVSVDTGVHFVVGTAPVQMVNGKVNQGQVHGVIYTHGEYFKYKTPMTGRLKAGTHPQNATAGQCAGQCDTGRLQNEK